MRRRMTRWATGKSMRMGRQMNPRGTANSILFGERIDDERLSRYFPVTNNSKRDKNSIHFGDEELEGERRTRYISATSN